MPHVKRSAILFLTVISCVGCDQTTKYTAKELLPPGSVIRLVNDTIRLQYIENSGAFLGLGASLSKETRFLIFTVFVFLALSVLVFYSLRSRTLPWLPALALSLFIGGGTSNLIDRLVYQGAVIDFLNIGIGNLRTGIFNVADVAIVAGAGLLVVSGLFDEGAVQE
jgi:signal peptidase II